MLGVIVAFADVHLKPRSLTFYVYLSCFQCNLDIVTVVDILFFSNTTCQSESLFMRLIWQVLY